MSTGQGGGGGVTSLVVQGKEEGPHLSVIHNTCKLRCGH